MQAKLLRVLENGEFQRVGETLRRVSRARVLAATNRDLRQEIRRGAFRADLYHRLSVLTLSVPPLRELGRDKLELLAHFRGIYAQQSGVQPFELDAAAERRWLAYPFPGNVRELRNIVIRLTTKHPGQKLGVEELEPEFDLEAQAGQIGGGSPDMDRAAAALERHDAVLGPAEDGGYVLVGLARDVDVFGGVPWSTPEVMAATRARLAAAGASHVELPPLWDVDTHDDFLRWSDQHVTSVSS